jgi:hypothetical protein
MKSMTPHGIAGLERVNKAFICNPQSSHYNVVLQTEISGCHITKKTAEISHNTKITKETCFPQKPLKLTSEMPH